ncbi:hypothetical protein Dimus_030407 [Dionaea muscipula]
MRCSDSEVADVGVSTGLVGGGVEQPASVEIGAGGEGGVGAHAIDTPADGFVREEVRVSPTARGALRPQPNDGLWQPPSSPVEPVSKSVEKDKGIHGGAFVAQEVHGGV